MLLPLSRTGLILLSAFCVAAAASEPLSLAQAEAMAIQRDAGRERLELEAAAQAERAVAAGSLPDPEVRLGAANLPVDSLALDAEPMTQLVVGIRQMFPPGETRAYRERRGRQLAAATGVLADERARQVRLAVRRAWFEAQAAAAMAERISATHAAVAPLLAAAAGRYATGTGRQADYLAAQLRLDRLRDRALQAEERRAAALAMLERWLGERVVPAPASLPPPEDFETLRARLETHPRAESAAARIAAGEAGEGLAREAFAPQWGLDFSYGHRRGVDAMTGAERPDFASAMVTFSLPLFTGNRQQRELAAAKRETLAAVHAREDVLRELAGRLDATWQRHRDIARQLELLENERLPAARRARDATERAYADNAVGFADLVDVEIDLLELELARLELRERLALARAEIRYLAGESP